MEWTAEPLVILLLFYALSAIHMYTSLLTKSFKVLTLDEIRRTVYIEIGLTYYRSLINVFD